jgi:hypothetical protein
MSPAPRGRPRGRPARAPRLELLPLEDRSVPTVTHTFVAGVLTIDSDAAGDTVRVVRENHAASDYHYVANGTKSISFTGVNAITVNGAGGTDTLDASGVATPIPFAPGKMAVVATTSYNPNYLPIWAVNGAGLGGDTHTATLADGYGGKTMWLTTNQASNLNGVKGQFLQIDLADVYHVSKLRVWNYNQKWTPPATVRGIKTADVLVSTDGTNFTTAVNDATLTQAPGTDTYDTPDTVYLPSAPAARYIRIVAESNFGPDAYGNYVGLSEVKVFGEAASGTLQGPKANPVAITASSTYPNMSPAQAGNGAGLNPFFPQFHDTNWQTAWMTVNKANVAGESVTFDLGTVQTLGRMHVWNFNQFYFTKYTHRGIKAADIQFSTNGTTFATVLSTTLSQASGSSVEAGQDVALPAIPTRYVRIVAQSNWGNNVPDAYGNFAGLSEVQFFGSTPAPAPALGVALNGGNDADTLTAGTGNDTLAGGAGADTHVFNPAFSAGAAGTKQATVAGFANGTDRLDLRPLGVTSETSLLAAGGAVNQVGPDTVLTVPPGFGPRSIRLTGFNAADLDDSDFVP